MNLLELNEEKVVLGSTVTVRDLDSGEIDVYTLVPPGQADIGAGRISSTTPVAHALYGRQAGDKVEVTAPGGSVRLTIESVTAQQQDYG